MESDTHLNDIIYLVPFMMLQPSSTVYHAFLSTMFPTVDQFNAVRSKSSTGRVKC